MIVVQRVVTSWTKKSRGGAAASRRNAVPEAFPLPTVEGAGVLVHDVDVQERDGFVPVESVRTTDQSPDVDWASLAAHGWRASRLSADPGTELHLAVAGVHLKARDATAIGASVPPVTRGVHLLESDDRLHVVTAPPQPASPSHSPRYLCVLAPGERTRWRFNGRFTPGGCGCRAHHWWYEKWVVHVAYRVTPDPYLFTTGTPSHAADNLTRLR